MKTLIIGLDGASPQLIEKWINQLPTFKRFKEEGTLGHSIPPAPAQTPVAWTTFTTGKNPSKHGIFSFAMRKIGARAGKTLTIQMNKVTVTHTLYVSTHTNKHASNKTNEHTNKHINRFMLRLQLQLRCSARYGK